MLAYSVNMHISSVTKVLVSLYIRVKLILGKIRVLG